MSRTLLQHHRTAILVAVGIWFTGLAFGLMMAVLYRTAAMGQEAAEQQTATLQQENERLRQRIEELEARILKPGSWVSAIQSADDLATLPPEEGWRFIQSTWSKLDDTNRKQQFLKAVAFSRHPWAHRGIHLGFEDTDLKVQSWAINYIRDYALIDAAEDAAAYRDWYQQHQDIHLSDAMASSLKQAASEMESAIEADDTATIVRLATIIGDSSVLRDTRTESLTRTVEDLNLPATLVTLLKSRDQNVRKAAAAALSRLPLTEDFAREHVAPLLKSADPETVNAIAGLLGQHARPWSTEVLLVTLEEGVRQNSLAHVFSVSSALAEHNEPSVIPAMIRLMETDDQYLIVYGIGYFGLGKLTGVKYDESHNAAWWKKWWKENQHRFDGGERWTGDPEMADSDDNSRTNTPDVLTADNDPEAQYLLLKGGADGDSSVRRKLLLVLPGGDGGADFRSFVARVASNCTGQDFVVAQLIAPEWNPDQHQQLVWPTRANPWKGMRFSTEEHAAMVINEIAKSVPIDASQVYVLAWSSGGPAAYAMAASREPPIAGALIAMSVFKPDQLPALEAVQGRRIYVLHSPEDFIPMRFPEAAVDQLNAAGATAKLSTYAGGHGWHGDVYGNIATGLSWLQARD